MIDIERAIAERWSIDIYNPVAIWGLCSHLQAALAPPNPLIANPIVRAITDIIQRRILANNLLIPELLKVRLAWLNERLNVLRYPSFPREWTSVDTEALSKIDKMHVERAENDKYLHCGRYLHIFEEPTQKQE
jgi:hypothetical protein